jgi:hypothetical protein
MNPVSASGQSDSPGTYSDCYVAREAVVPGETNREGMPELMDPGIGAHIRSQVTLLSGVSASTVCANGAKEVAIRQKLPARMRCLVCHSARMTAVGSTRTARSAGASVPSIAVIAHIAAAVENVNTSAGLTPASRLSSNFAAT